MKKQINLLIMVKGALVGGALSTVIWLILAMLYRPTSSNATYMVLAGALLWGSVWLLGGAIIGLAGSRYQRWIAAGAGVGLMIGVASGLLINIWPKCSEINLTDWAIQASLEFPIKSALYFLLVKPLQLVGRSIELNGILEDLVVIVSSILLWSLVAITIALIARFWADRGSILVNSPRSNSLDFD